MSVLPIELLPSMPINRRDIWPVAVVGAGPAGLVSAITLAHAGIKTLVISPRTAVFSHPRATVVSLRSMELFRSWGLEGEIRSGGDEVEWRMLLAPTLSQVAVGSLIDVGYPTASESARLSPTRPAAVPQDHLERVLLHHLQTLPRPASSSESPSRTYGSLRPATDSGSGHGTPGGAAASMPGT